MAINWTQKLEDAFVDGILAGTSISKLCSENKISPASFYRHRLDSAEFETTIARAQEGAQEREMDGLIELADTANEDNANAVKLKVWTRMWIAGKRKPKKYGEKLDLNHTGELGIKTVVVVGQAKDSQKPELKPSFTPELTSGSD